MTVTEGLEESVTKALSEVSFKSLRQVQFETAIVWYGRAVAAKTLAKSADAIEYAHESIEHAALSGDMGLLQSIRDGLRRNGIAL